MGAVTLLAALASPVLTGTAAGNAQLDALTEVDCAATETYGGDAADAALGAHYKANGFTCTALLNKGQVAQGNYARVGELWQKKSGSILQMRTILFGKANTGLSADAKVCLDDDVDPINDVAPGGTAPSFCEGNDLPNKVPHGVTGGPSYPPAKLAGDPSEEAAGKFELMVQTLVQVSDDPDGTGPTATGGGFDVNVDGYTEALVHFNKDDLSIVAYFQPAASTTTTTTQDPQPSVRVDKSASPTSVAEPGGSVTFTVEVTNTSADPADLDSLDDSIYGDVTDPTNVTSTDCATGGTIAAGATYTCRFTADVTGDAGDTHTNTITAEVSDADNDTASDSDDATVTVTDVLPTISVDKSASASVVRTGQQVTYTYVVTTGGPESLANVAVTDDKCSPVTFVSGDIDGDTLLDPGESWRHTCTTTLTGDTVNTATATGNDDDGNTATDTDTASVAVIDPRIAIDKSADPKSTSPGGAVTYTYLVTNPGSGELSNVAVTDDKCSPVAFVSGDTDGDGRLDTGETWRYTCSIVASSVGTLTNIATVTATDPTGARVSADDTESIVVEPVQVLGQVADPQQPAVGGTAPSRPRALPANAGAELPATGGNWTLLFLVGLELILVGLVLMLPTRRPRTT